MSSESAVVARWLVVALILAASRGPVQAQTVPALVSAGTLTCLTSETPPPATAVAELSCRFHAVSGKDFGFAGYIARKGQADLPTGKRVLVWTVQATTTPIEPSAIAGRYTGQTGGQPAGRLIGGTAGGIILDPVDRTVRAGDESVPTVLELRVVPFRA